MCRRRWVLVACRQSPTCQEIWSRAAAGRRRRWRLAAPSPVPWQRHRLYSMCLRRTRTMRTTAVSVRLAAGLARVQPADLSRSLVAPAALALRRPEMRRVAQRVVAALGRLTPVAVSIDSCCWIARRLTMGSVPCRAEFPETVSNSPRIAVAMRLLRDPAETDRMVRRVAVTGPARPEAAMTRWRMTAAAGRPGLLRTIERAMLMMVVDSAAAVVAAAARRTPVAAVWALAEAVWVLPDAGSARRVEAAPCP